MPAVPFKVKAIFEYRSDEADDLNFDNGQIITVTEEEDADWYTGEYVDASGEKLQGLFPRNFVEKYEPTIPSRPVRAPRRAPVPEPSERVPEPPAPEPLPPPTETSEPVHEEEKEPVREPAEPARADPEVPPPAPKPQPVAPTAPTTVPTSPPAAARAPPPVADKPSSSSFKDRIAAFNKPAAAPIAPFKPGGGGPSSGFIRKPFVAPPPSRNAFVPPPPREAPIQKPYRREDDADVNGADSKDPAEPTVTQLEPEAEEQPKPQSLKERIALLQKQQLEQAARNAEKKEKPKKPPKKRVETTDSGEQIQPPEPTLTRLDSNETVGRSSAEVADGEHDHVGLARRTTGLSTPLPASRELVSDTNDADDSGAGDDDDGQETSTEEERPKSKDTDIPIPAAVPRKSMDEDRKQEQQGEEEEEAEEEEEEEDPEIRRRRELRDRMAKMSGGMGMMGMFGPPGGIGLPGAARKPKPEPSRQASESHAQDEPQERPAPVRIMALPGMGPSIPKRQEEPVASPESDEDETARPTPQEPGVHGETEDYVSKPLQRRSTERSAPPVPQDRIAPPPPLRSDTRGAPPPPPEGPRAAPPVPQSPTARSVPPPPPSLPQASAETPGYDEEDEADESPEEDTQEAPETPAGAPAIPPIPPARSSQHSTFDAAGSSMSPVTDKRASRPPPPIPMSPTSPQTRAPPPPPPGAPPSRRSTTDSRGFGTVHSPKPDVDEEEEVTEYDGDYDTDIASSAKHKDALKAHNRDSSLDEGALTDDMKSPKHAPPRAAPPLPPVSVPRDMPPAPPSLPTPKSRRSMDAPRAAPPPVPPPKVGDDDDYDPYRYSAPQHPPPSLHTKAPYSTSLQSPREELEEDDMYSAMPQQTTIPPPPTERPAPPPPLPEPAEYIAPPSLAPPPPTDPFEQSTDLRRSGTLSRRSMDHSRGSTEQGYIAQDIDLGKGSMWWTQDNLPPPSLQGRPDILYEMETASSSKRGGRTTISKDIYVLYIDYSQTTINVSYDAADPTHVTLEQNHGRPPPAPRRDQLENASMQYGNQIARVASGLSGTTVGDGSARGFVLELLKPHPTALLPVGTRAYGALVYSNLGNASTQQFDEIRPGDIVTFRNAKFSGHKGGLHQKYSVDVGKPEHVAVVIDWDGTKKKIRAWEQGRDLEKGKKPKVKEESFKVGDLKSGEVMVWRIMPRTWVNWDTTKS
ncbi:uncharacterized protein Z520_03241 [Fonsecaea multimorphosa CBS 102226]|uniref:SH3 domain-containing protein n=1 Tax=Fonsecaea multimorphosa CBS 102226 TaxID=1442371 RepID=A0A0D2K422_9EURO|nr:uncharacterized protein Z520_03241 [Fonsecaea multimorphosa CBS 102226]KIY00578.1 hypothetical protein Z520_03241 [Fonsecaea multimorphosa CBS 102226]OAL18972.1 hypothetical protein AYO22_10301 [Fonsecaea multimorphosa]